MQKELGLAGRCGFALLSIAVVALPIALFAKGIDVAAFVAVATVWLLVSAMLIFGDSVTEIKVWETSIKRDVRAAQEARQGAEQVLAQLRDITRLVIENEYVLLSGSQLANLGHPSVAHVQGNLDALTDKILVAGEDKEKWQARMKALMQQPFEYR
ncbi:MULTISPECIES: hypothetical protein [Pseudomonas]|uniref:Uncharacterized protein n=1 Tax=Pseudomonas fluorescens TaxID=294 RepID=A0AAE2A347_PSEFL|nr:MULTISPECIES: hypothetical protein [Pseudomonas]KIF56195.1 hypothetical protein QS95_25250 [Pseudomonas fluorescens]MBX8621681.1 hypothetical protein [Pseudomonas glycinae]